MTHFALHKAGSEAKEPGCCMLFGCGRSSEREIGRTHKDIRGQSIDLFAGRSRWVLADVQKRIPRHSVLCGIETSGRAAEKTGRDGAITKGIVGGEVDGESGSLTASSVGRGAPGFYRVQEMSVVAEAVGGRAESSAAVE